MLEDQDVAYYEYGGEAVAVGEETFTQVDSTSIISDHGPVTTARINIKAKAVAVAEDDSTAASADTYVYSNSDISILVKFEEGSLEYDGVSYDISNAKFIGVCLPSHVDLPNGSKNKVIIINHGEDTDLDPALDGNVAALSLDAQIEGDSTSLNAELSVLASEDTLSISAFYMEVVVG